MLHFFHAHTKRERETPCHIHLAFKPKLHCEIPCLNAPADRRRLGQLTCPTLPFPQRAVSRPSIVGNILRQPKAMYANKQRSPLCTSYSHCLPSSAYPLHTLFSLPPPPSDSQSVNQLASRLAISESPVKLSSGRCELAAALAKLDEVPESECRGKGRGAS